MDKPDKIKINCECGNEFFHEVDWQSFEGESTGEERPMGPELVHECFVNIVCPKCKRTLKKVDVYEYSDGIFNHAIGHYEEV